MTAQELIGIWEETAAKHGYALGDGRAERIRKAAAICIGILKGACICKPNERPVCPCEEMHEDIKDTGRCFCGIFYAGSPKKAS